MTPTWVAARPMPSASCMSWPMRRASSASALVEPLDLERAAAQHRVAVLADELERGVAARPGLRVEPVVELLGLLVCGGGIGSSWAMAPGVYCGSTSTLNATSR